MKRIMVFTMLIFIISISVFSKVIPFEELTKPTSMTVTNGYIYVVEGMTVNVYNKKDFKFIKKFGRKGEGPGEFSNFVIIDEMRDKIAVNTMKKISYYSKEGKLLLEKPITKNVGFVMRPLGKNYLGLAIETENGKMYRSATVFDSNFKKIKTIDRMENFLTKSGKIQLLKEQLIYVTKNNRGYVSTGRSFYVKIIDENGKLIKMIERDYKKVKFTEIDKQKLLDEFKKNPQTAPYFEMIKQRALYPNYYPDIANLIVDNNYLYIMTFKRVKDSYEFFIYDLKGKFVKKTMVKFKYQTVMQPFPMSIYDNVAYGMRLAGVKNKSELDDRVEKALQDAAIWKETKDRLHTSALGMSGGQQQRLCIARAVALKPDVMLFDEPTSALDPISTGAIEELIAELKDEVSIVIVTHNMQQASRLSDYTAFMYLGDLIEYDKTDTIFMNPSQKLTEDYITGRFG